MSKFFDDTLQGLMQELQESTGITADKMPKGGKSH